MAYQYNEVIAEAYVAMKQAEAKKLEESQEQVQEEIVTEEAEIVSEKEECSETKCPHCGK